MLTLLNTHIHTPFVPAISTVETSCYMERHTFCMECEENIESWLIHDDEDRLPFWSNWKTMCGK